MSLSERPPRYQTYLLIIWKERSRDPEVPGVWRFSLEDPRTGHRRGFASLETLVTALMGEMAAEKGSQLAESRDEASRTR